MWLPRRVDKYLRECTNRSLAELRAACASGRATRIDSTGETLTLAADELVFEGDVVELDRQVLSARRGYDYLAFHKPLGTVSTVRDPAGLADLSSWLPHLPEGVFPIGRLDRMTSGLLLWTNDGDFANAMLLPQHHVEKHYLVSIEGHIAVDDPRLAQLVRGVEVNGHADALRATSATIARASAARTELLLTLREGKHRQIRKMCQALNLHLVGLYRQAVGCVRIDGLGAGDWRRLSSEEVEELWASAGGRTLVQARQMLALRQRALEARANHRPLPRLEHWLEQCGE